MRTRVWTMISLMGLALVTGCTGSSNGDDDRSSRFVTFVAPDDRKTAPALAGPDLDERAFSTADFAGKVIVLNLWGPWCAPCRAEAPVLRQVSEEYAAKDVQFIGMVNDADDDWARSFAAKAGLRYPNFSDQGGKLELGFKDSLPAVGVPTTWVLDRDGKVAARIMDSDLAASTLAGVLDDVLAEPHPSTASPREAA